MDNLFDHPGFRLIYVDQNGFMSLVTPLTDGSDDVLKNGYRCISHYWGPNPPKWENHPVNGAYWGVHVREEKRRKLLRILDYFKGYWWVDVFCTNQDDISRPLDVMGDIYKNCKECVCLLDYSQDTYEHEHNIMRGDTWSSCNYVFSLDKCKWFTRVWTLQEYLLPPSVIYTSEGDSEAMHLISTEQLHKICKSIYLDGNTFVGIDMFVERHKYNLKTMGFQKMLRYIAKMKRESTKEEDYYYGIAGLLEFPLTPNLGFDRVEKEFIRYCKIKGSTLTVRRYGNDFYSRMSITDSSTPPRPIFSSTQLTYQRNIAVDDYSEEDMFIDDSKR
jgi:hypothetical protein